MHSIIFLGTSAFAVPSLKALAGDPRFKIELVVTQPDRPVGRKQALTPPPVKLAAEALGLKIWQPENINKELDHFQFPISNFQFLVVVSYGQILSEEILDLPKTAPINVHASLLPLLRGASPIQHAILQNFNETGVTVQKMVKELDAGPVLSQKIIPIGSRETFVTLHDTLADVGAKLLIDTLGAPLNETPQDASKATFCKKLTRADGNVDPKTMTAEEIDRRVRALTPWPGVTLRQKLRVERGGSTIGANKILETSLIGTPDALALPCAEGTTLFIEKIQPAAGKPMSGKAFGAGNRIGQ